MTKQPKGDTLIGIANALGVPLKAILKKNAKLPAGHEEALNAIYAGLSASNKAALMATAEALLKSQKGGK